MDVVSFVIETFSFAGFVLAAIVASIFPMIPEEIFLVSLGYLSAQSDFTVSTGLLTLFLVMGFLIVDSVIYYAAHKGNRVAHKFASFILGDWFSADDSFVKKHIAKIVFFSRFVVQIRFIGPFLAGTSGFAYRRFIFMDALALLIYVPLMLWIGAVFQSRVEQITQGVGVLSNIALMMVALLILFALARFFLNAFKKRYDGVPSTNPIFGFRRKKKKEKS